MAARKAKFALSTSKQCRHRVIARLQCLHSLQRYGCISSSWKSLQMVELALYPMHIQQFVLQPGLSSIVHNNVSSIGGIL
ncbi:hypothetical protein CEXT_47991 [Caerostris extrusa]|uniref:Uncharacterized protein n=1 Tax=Caerostris extrusa TaxID=172846 RepID=A0AAV4MXT7_CAEEX|nr:hypothetical protein CEXT_47991 [Caerostris extrusa]